MKTVFNRDLRSLARSALKGRWVKLSLLMLLGGILGGNIGALWPAEILGDVWDIIDKYRVMAIFEDLEPEQLRRIVQAIRFDILALAGKLIYSLLLGGIASLALVSIGLETLDGTPLGSAMLFPGGIYWKVVRLNLLRSMIVCLWTLLLIVPGVIAAHSYAMAEYLLLQNPDMGVREILRESRKRMLGNRGSLFFLQFSFIGWQLLAALPGSVLIYTAAGRGASLAGAALILLLGCIVAAYENTALAAFYRNVDAGKEIIAEIP